MAGQDWALSLLLLLLSALTIDTYKKSLTIDRKYVFMSGSVQVTKANKPLTSTRASSHKFDSIKARLPAVKQPDAAKCGPKTMDSQKQCNSNWLHWQQFDSCCCRYG